MDYRVLGSLLPLPRFYRRLIVHYPLSITAVLLRQETRYPFKTAIVVPIIVWFTAGELPVSFSAQRSVIWTPIDMFACEHHHAVRLLVVEVSQIHKSIDSHRVVCPSSSFRLFFWSVCLSPFNGQS